MPHQTGKEINSVCAGGDREGDLNVIHTHLVSRQFSETIL